VDANNDGLISFTEFFYFITILFMPDDIIIANFKAYRGDNDITKSEFDEMLYNHRKDTKFGRKLSDKKTILVSRNVSATEEDFKTTNTEMTEQIFKEK
jgi:hypothetical protein